MVQKMTMKAKAQPYLQIITSGISNTDVGVFKRVLTLMSHLLMNLDDLQFPSYAEWVGCKVRIPRNLTMIRMAIMTKLSTCDVGLHLIGSNQLIESICFCKKLFLYLHDGRFQQIQRGYILMDAVGS